MDRQVDRQTGGLSDRQAGGQADRQVSRAQHPCLFRLQAGAPGAPGRSMGDSMAEETRVIYHLEDQDTPYLIRINVPARRVTLADFKQVLNKPNVKFFLKSVDDDFG